jgi:tetratricopeptide (TPR) repeat protein
MNQALPVTTQTGPPGVLAFPEATQLSADGLRFFRDGLALMENGQPRAAGAAFSRAIESSPAFADAHICLGAAHAMASSIYPAFDHLERAVELEPQSFTAHFLLAQLNFKLRIPQKGYQQAEQALRCAASREQRKMVGRLLQQERQREHNGIARPWFNKPFRTSVLLLAGSGIAAALVALIVHLQ